MTMKPAAARRVRQALDVLGSIGIPAEQQTEVWIADAPDHLIHFDGERFLGPYPQ